MEMSKFEVCTTFLTPCAVRMGSHTLKPRERKNPDAVWASGIVSSDEGRTKGTVPSVCQA